MSIQTITITFPTKVTTPAGFEQLLCAALEMVCKKWEQENPTMTMWVAGIGADHTHPGWADDGHPMQFDDSVLLIEVEAKEDDTGHNPHNPDREALRTHYLAERQTRSQSRTLEIRRLRATLAEIAQTPEEDCDELTAKTMKSMAVSALEPQP